MPELSPLLLVYTGVCIFLAGIVRGATGFGFSMIMIVLLTFFLSPVQVAPVILFWEIMASIGHLPFVWREVDWKALRWLAAGVLIGTPAGVWFLVSMPVDLMCLVINGLVLVSTLLLFAGYRPRRAPGTFGTIGVGTLSGLMNGASANGGPPVILLFLAGPAGAATGRASLIAFFLFTDVTASFFCWRQGIVTADRLLFALAFALPMFAGMFLGSRWFRTVDETRFRRLVMVLLMLLALAGMMRALQA